MAHGKELTSDKPEYARIYEYMFLEYKCNSLNKRYILMNLRTYYNRYTDNRYTDNRYTDNRYTDNK